VFITRSQTGAIPPPVKGYLLDRIAGLSERLPLWTGDVFVLLGLWSISFGLKA
jgi:hypothetical protein